MVALCTCLACCSLSFISAGYAHKLFLVRSGESLSVYGFMVVGWYALLQAGSLVRCVWCDGRHNTSVEMALEIILQEL
jgi:hypothetical protein